MRSDRERLEDILEAIDRIEKYTALGKARFQADELVQNWVTHHIQIIGEACRALTPEFKSIITMCHGQKLLACGIFSSTIILELI